MEDKACQSFPLDWNDLHSCCPCCGQVVKIVFNWSPEGVDFTLIPVSSTGQGTQSQQHLHSSLMNIVSVTGNSVASKDGHNNNNHNNTFIKQEDLSIRQNHHLHHRLDEEDDSNETGLNDSSSSSNSLNLSSTLHSFLPPSSSIQGIQTTNSNTLLLPTTMSSNHHNNQQIHPVVSGIGSAFHHQVASFHQPRKIDAVTLQQAQALAVVAAAGVVNQVAAAGKANAETLMSVYDPFRSHSSSSVTGQSSQSGPNQSLPVVSPNGVHMFPNHQVVTSGVNKVMQPQLQQQQGTHKCTVVGCNQTFINVQQLELHYKEHKGEKIQKCDWFNCNRLFSSKEKLRNHIRCRHTGERPFKCDDCSKAFTSPKHLKDHRLLHTDERPFECDWEGCRLKFRRRHHLVAHKRVHTKERPFACSFPGCDMKFTKSHHVKRHYETHFKYKGLSSVAGSLDNPSSSTSTQSSHLPSSLLTSSSSPSPVQYSLVVPPVRDNLGLPGYVLTYPS